MKRRAHNACSRGCEFSNEVVQAILATIYQGSYIELDGRWPLGQKPSLANISLDLVSSCNRKVPVLVHY